MGRQLLTQKMHKNPKSANLSILGHFEHFSRVPPPASARLRPPPPASARLRPSSARLRPKKDPNFSFFVFFVFWVFLSQFLGSFDIPPQNSVFFVARSNSSYFWCVFGRSLSLACFGALFLVFFNPVFSFFFCGFHEF